MSSLSDPTRKTVVSHDPAVGRLRGDASVRRLDPSRLVLWQPTYNQLSLLYDEIDRSVQLTLLYH
jgi:hypothetical protein